MNKEIKQIVSEEETLDKLEIRVGRILSASSSIGAMKPAYVITADFGKFGVHTSVGRFTQHSADELVGKQILGVLNF